MKDFWKHYWKNLYTTVIIAFTPLSCFFSICLNTFGIVGVIVVTLSILVISSLVAATSVDDECKTVAQELTKRFEAEIKELRGDLEDEKTSKHLLFMECETAAESERNASNAVIADLQAEIERLSMRNYDEFFGEVMYWLFPEISEESIAAPDGLASYTELWKSFCERCDAVAEYNKNVEFFKKGLNDFRYRPYIYTTLAEACRNKMIADCVRGTLQQNEAFPTIARVVAELQTAHLDAMAMSLMWGNDIQRAKKVASLHELKKQTKSQLEAANFAKYQLEYLLGLYPQLQEVLDVDYKDLDIPTGQLPSEEEHDTVRDYLSYEEYTKLSETERNQLALDRYIERRNKSKWQIGRDYELYIGYLCEARLCCVEYTGSTLKLEDLGRDLIVSSPFGKTYIIQCKYWSKEKTIHEKHIAQLFGTLTEYNITHNDNAEGVFVTSTTLSDMAKLFAKRLKIEVYENVPMGDFPRIKCNINRTAEGGTTYIYHLPMDFSYDVTKIVNEGEFMAFTVKEAEKAGFRRSYRWSGARGYDIDV